MKRKVEIIDGIEISTWKEIEKISKLYPKPIRYAEGTQARLFLLKFYMEPLNYYLHPMRKWEEALTFWT